MTRLLKYSLILCFTSLSGCGKSNYVPGELVPIEYIIENSDDLEGIHVLTSGLIKIHPDLRLFMDRESLNTLGAERLEKTISLYVEFDYEFVINLDCYGKIVNVKGTVTADNDLPGYHYLSGTVTLINEDGSICHVFD